MSAKPKPLGGRRRGWGPRALLGAALLLLVIAAGHALAWRWMAGQLQAGYAAWAAERRAQGWQVAHAAPLGGGWPFAATLALPQFRLTGGGRTLPGGMDWQAEALELRVTLLRPDRLLVAMPGRHRLRLGEAELPFAAKRLTAEMPIEANVLPRQVRLEAERLQLGEGAGAAEAGRAWLAVETRITAIEGEPAVTLRSEAEAVLLPAGGGPAAPVVASLGRMVQQMGLDLALTGPVPPARDPTGRATAWRDGGGTLELQRLELQWGPVAASTTATLTLDEALQPMGAGTLRLAGAEEVLAAATAAGLLTPSNATTVRTVVRLLARQPPEGGPARIEVPLTLEERSLTLARIPLLRLPPWHWPATTAREQPDGSPVPRGWPAGGNLR